MLGINKTSIHCRRGKKRKNWTSGSAAQRQWAMRTFNPFSIFMVAQTPAPCPSPCTATNESFPDHMWLDWVLEMRSLKKVGASETESPIILRTWRRLPFRTQFCRIGAEAHAACWSDFPVTRWWHARQCLDTQTNIGLIQRNSVFPLTNSLMRDENWWIGQEPKWTSTQWNRCIFRDSPYNTVDAKHLYNSYVCASSTHQSPSWPSSAPLHLWVDQHRESLWLILGSLADNFNRPVVIF